MVSTIQPLNREWFYGLVFQPYKEGAERVNRAFAGVDFLTLELRTVSLKERAISLITGILLLMPLVNTIVWIAMQTFGESEYLTDPYISPIEPENGSPEPCRECSLAVEENSSVISTESISVSTSPTYMTTLEKQGDHEEEWIWKFEVFSNHILVTKDAEKEFVVSKYDLQGNIEEYHFQFQDKTGELHIEKQGEKLQLNGVKKGYPNQERTLNLKDGIPWIQQLTIGLKQFVLSPDQKLEFYIVNPKDLNLYKLIAEKKRTEHVPEFGSLMKVDVYSDSIFYNFLGLGGKLWFDQETGELRKMIAHIDPREGPMITEWKKTVY